MNAGPQRTLLRGGSVYSPADPFATAMVIDRGEVVWIGSDIGGDVHRDTVDVVVELDGALVTPAFVDAHVHATATGITLRTSDLAAVRSRAELLAALASTAAATEPGGVVLAHGWDESIWPDQQLPTQAEFDAAVGGRPAYVTRTDVHSALVSTALANAMPDLPGIDGFASNPVINVRREAHAVVRTHAQTSISQTQQRAAQSAMLAHAASRGIAAVHEMAGPTVSSAGDLFGLLDLAASGFTPQVVGYWGELQTMPASTRPLAGAAGDLFVDGSIGSRTAFLRADYNDGDGIGAHYATAAQLRDHLIWCTQQEIQAGFHVIGDAAIDLVVAALTEAAAIVGPAAMRARRHRLEHAEMVDDAHLATLLDLGVFLSMQPAFDARWGGGEQMYAKRLGLERAVTLNPLARISRAGVPMAFGSDAPVTPLDPWGSVRAAAFMHQPEFSLPVRAAFQAHTRGGWRAAGIDDAGVLAPGYAAHYAVWRATDLVVQSPDERVANWSTDPRSGTPGLPDLTPGLELPRALRTVVAGRTIFDSGDLTEVTG